MMKYLPLCLVFCFPLTACFVEDVTPIEAKIEYPPLASEKDVTELMEEPVVAIANVADANNVFSDVLTRLMNVVEIANQLADEISDGVAPNPVYKPMARELKIIDATSDLCANEGNDTSQTSSLIWNDVDNNNNPSKGDEWFYIWEGCENSSNGSTVTGVMSFTGMLDPLNQLGSGLEISSFSNYQYSFDLEISGLNENTVFFKNTKFVFSFDEDEIAKLEILPGSIMGVTSESGLYAFDVNAATLVSDDDASTLALSLDARYFDSSDGLAGYVNVATTTDLLFGYARDSNSGAIIIPRLTSGALEITAKDDEKLSLTVDTDTEKLKLGFDADGGESKVVDQSTIFDLAQFSLVNITGGP